MSDLMAGEKSTHNIIRNPGVFWNHEGSAQGLLHFAHEIGIHPRMLVMAASKIVRFMEPLLHEGQGCAVDCMDAVDAWCRGECDLAHLTNVRLEAGEDIDDWMNRETHLYARAAVACALAAEKPFGWAVLDAVAIALEFGIAPDAAVKAVRSTIPFTMIQHACAMIQRRCVPEGAQ